ncbi:MAG: YkgJ family cysteine cluster protein [Planctomycetes bacterium]|nr:YkgJ family cysteine cluster protein [Planctomycetota bacterium]
MPAAPAQILSRPARGNGIVNRMTTAARVFMPADLRYDCHACGRCCRDWMILCSEAEAQRTLSRDWGELFPDLKGVPVFEPPVQMPEGRMYRLSHKADGTCIFLDGNNRCRIHEQLGSAAKPLVCRIYPYTFTHTPSGIFVSVKMSCPSAIAGKGRPMEEQREEVAALASAAARDILPTPISGTVRFTRKLRLPWTDLIGVQEVFDGLFRQRGIPFFPRLVSVLRLARLLSEARLSALEGGQAIEFCRIMGKDFAAQASAGQMIPPGLPKTGTRIQFRQFLRMFTLREFVDFAGASFFARMKLQIRFFTNGLRFALGRGEIVMRDLGGALPLPTIDAMPPPPAHPEIEAMFERFCSSKIFGQLTYGPNAGGQPYLTGIAVLGASCAAIGWYARASAYGRKSAAVEPQDVAEAIRIVDSTLTSSRIFFSTAARAVVAGITHQDAAERLVWAWMAAPAPVPAVVAPMPV